MIMRLWDEAAPLVWDRCVCLCVYACVCMRVLMRAYVCVVRACMCV